MTPYPHESNGPRVKARVIPGTVGIKELDILVDNYVLYKIKIVYDTNKAQTKCFIRKIIDGNDSYDTATYLDVNGSYSDVLSDSNDVDFYKLIPDSNGKLSINFGHVF